MKALLGINIQIMNIYFGTRIPWKLGRVLPIGCGDVVVGISNFKH